MHPGHGSSFGNTNAPAVAAVGGACESDNIKVENFQPILNSGSCRILVLPLDLGKSWGNSVLRYQNTAGLEERHDSPSSYGKGGKKIKISKFKLIFGGQAGYAGYGDWLPQAWTMENGSLITAGNIKCERLPAESAQVCDNDHFTTCIMSVSQRISSYSQSKWIGDFLLLPSSFGHRVVY